MFMERLRGDIVDVVRWELAPLRTRLEHTEIEVHALRERVAALYKPCPSCEQGKCATCGGTGEVAKRK